MVHASQCRRAIPRRAGRGDVDGARRGASGRAAAINETRLGRSSRMAGGARHASYTDVGAAGARRRAVFGAKAPHSLGSALVAGRAPDHRLEHIGILLKEIRERGYETTGLR